MKRTLLIAAVAAAFTGAALAETPAKAGAQATDWHQWAEDFRHNMRASMGTLFADRVGSHRLVKNAPYSAEVITEINQALADGNVISKKKVGRVYRDGEGRTRQETAAEGKEPTIYIYDPVDKKNIVLHPGAKRALVSESRREHRDVHRMKLDGTDIRIEDGHVFVDGKEVGGGKVEMKSAKGKSIRIENGKVWIDGKEISGTGPHNVIVKRVGDTVREEVRVQLVRPDGEVVKDLVVPTPPVPPVPPVPPMPPAPPSFGHLLPGAHTFRFDTGSLGKGVTTQLGTKDFDGVKAEGKSTVWTIPAGQIGNRNPINVTSESWYSPELKVTVYSRHSDPRQGESIYRLSAIKRSEPPADLFKVPEGYETKSRGKR